MWKLLNAINQQLLVKKFGKARLQKDIGPKFPVISMIGVPGIVFVALAPIIPVQSAARYVKFTDRIFRAPPETSGASA